MIRYKYIIKLNSCKINASKFYNKLKRNKLQYLRRLEKSESSSEHSLVSSSNDVAEEGNQK